MAFSVRNSSVERKARDYATRHGMTLTGTLDRALDRLVADEKSDREAEYRVFKARIREIQDAYAEAGASGLTEQDIMGWDENGLPT